MRRMNVRSRFVISKAKREKGGTTLVILLSTPSLATKTRVPSNYCHWKKSSFHSYLLMTWNHPGMKIPTDFRNSNSRKNSEWLTIPAKYFFLRFCDHSALLIQLLTWCWDQLNRTAISWQCTWRKSKQTEFVDDCAKKTTKNSRFSNFDCLRNTRCVSTKRGRRKCQERSLAAYVERKP